MRIKKRFNYDDEDLQRYLKDGDDDDDDVMNLVLCLNDVIDSTVSRSLNNDLIGRLTRRH